MNRLNNSLFSLVAISASSQLTTVAADGGAISKATANTTTPSVVQTNRYTTTQDNKMRNISEVLQIIKKTNIVCFDVDSTVIREEGIDELAHYCGKGDEVKRLTKEAMKGSMTFQDALKLRLDIIRPSQKQIKEFLLAKPSQLSTSIREFINDLKLRNIPIYLISGGFDCLIEPIANELNIHMDHVFANKLMFYYNGEYAGFDTTQPTSHTGGKGEAISLIRKNHLNINGNSVITMIGDGATDLEAAPPADYFIGYGGNIVRDEVRNRAQYYITDFTQLMDNQIKLVK